MPQASHKLWRSNQPMGIPCGVAVHLVCKISGHRTQQPRIIYKQYSFQNTWGSFLILYTLISNVYFVCYCFLWKTIVETVCPTSPLSRSCEVLHYPWMSMNKVLFKKSKTKHKDIARHIWEIKKIKTIFLAFNLRVLW